MTPDFTLAVTKTCPKDGVHLSVKEISIEWHYRQDSKVSVVRDPIRMFRDLWTIRLNRIRGVYTDELPAQPRS